ncbi:DUF3772 domain-containing protein [Octadecabacter sp. R77987]|uniref:DUF3772 domain-containing protein n=1 Tax=Octadecabacter sp. R77987 TaxID=3093874 RepID=UPI00366B029C
MRIIRFAALWLLLVLPLDAIAQDTSDDTAAAEAVQAETLTRETVAGIDYGQWDSVASRAESALEAGRASSFALEQLRAELVEWRDTFLAGQSVNSARIETVSAQISALGPTTNEAGDPIEESPAIAARRSVLNDQLDRLQAPVILAEEAHTQANGLISEIDTLIRDRQAQALYARDTSPLMPQNWTATWDAVKSGGVAIYNEARATLNNQVRRAVVISAAPAAGLLALVGFVLLLRGQRWAARLQNLVVARSRRGRGVWDFVISLSQIILPLLGVVAVTAAVDALGVLGQRGTALLNVLPAVALFVLFARWLSGHFFADADGQVGVAPLDFAPEKRSQGRWLSTSLGWLLGARILLESFLTVIDASAAVQAVVLLPVAVLVALMLFRLGQMLVRYGAAPPAPADQDDMPAPRPYTDRLVALVGRILVVIAAIAPLLAVLGYTAAANTLLYPAVMSLGVLGVVLLLQILVFDIYTLLTRAEDGSRDALIPVLIGFVLMLLALPVLSLVWGARVADLTELWTRFRQGFSIGATQISPTSFLTFAIVFAIGYTVTRLVQGTLRTTVLPKTRMDIGGQNAVVSGLGYVGIFLAALVAITTAGIDLSGLAIVAGALSVGIGFGLQNIVSNFVAGIILLIERPISEGDWIEVGNQMGYVRDISVRSTRIETFDRTDVIVPNADLVSGQVINWTRGNSIGRVIVPVGVAYGTDTDRISDMLLELAQEHPMVLANPAPSVVFQGFGADSLDFEIRAILRDVNWVLKVKSDLNHAIARKFAEEGIEIPFAQRDVWLRNPETLPGAAKPKPKPKPKAKDGTS